MTMCRITLFAWLAAQSWMAAQVTHANGPIIDNRGANPSTPANFNQNPLLISPKTAAAGAGGTTDTRYGSGATANGTFNPTGTSGNVNIPGLPGAGILNPALLSNTIVPLPPAAASPAPPAAPSPAEDYLTVPLTSDPNQIDDKYFLKPNDKIIYQVAEDEVEPQLLLVNEQGLVLVPFLKDPVDVVGKQMKLKDFVTYLGDKDKGKLILSGLYKTATIRVALYHGAHSRGYVTVNGSVQGGKVRIQVPADAVLTLADVLNQAGIVGNPDMRHVRITRQASDPTKDPITILEDVKALNDKGQEPTMLVQPGDFVNVPSLTETVGTVMVTGEIPRQPGAILPLPANQPLTVSIAIIQSGGWTDFSKHNVYVYRYEKDKDGKTQRRTYRVDVDAVLVKGEREKDMDLQDGDQIWVQGGFIATR